MLGDSVVKDDFIAFFHFKTVINNGAKANLWTLKVLEDCYWLTNTVARFADPANLVITLAVVTVTKVKTEAVYTRSGKFFNFFWCACDGTEGRQNLGAFKYNTHIGVYCTIL